MTALPDHVRRVLIDHALTKGDDGLISCSCGIWITPWEWSINNRRKVRIPFSPISNPIPDFDRWLLHIEDECRRALALDAA